MAKTASSAKEGGHGKRKHAKFSPSSSKRWRKCQGSINLIKKAPPQASNEAADEGTNAHECLEFLVRRYSNIDAAAEQARNTFVKDKETNRKVRRWPDEMVDHCVRCAHEVFKLRPSPTAKLLIEARVRLSKEVYGSLDYAWLEYWGWLVIIDFKYGFHPVLPWDADDEEENSQLMVYGTALAKKYGYEFDRVKLAILQPRVWKDDDNPLTEFVTPIKRLRLFEKEIERAVAAAKKPDAPLAHGEHCRWCPAAVICPEVSEARMEEAGIVFDTEEGVKKLPKVEALSPKAIAVALKAGEAIKFWIAQVEVAALRLASEGTKIPGKKLVEKRSTRSWNPGAERKALKLFGDKIYKKEFISPAQLEKTLGVKAKKFTKKFTSSGSSGYSLVNLSDKRAEVTSTVAFDLESEGEV